jgi:hypothetical protein
MSLEMMAAELAFSQVERPVQDASISAFEKPAMGASRVMYQECETWTLFAGMYGSAVNFVIVNL